MAACHSPQNGDQADQQKNSVGPFNKFKRQLWFRLGLGQQPTGQEQRLYNEKHQCEEQPNGNHRVDPPISRIAESIPQIETSEHVESRHAHDGNQKSRRPGESPLDPIEKFQLAFRLFEVANRRQQYSRHEPHTSDPQHDRNDMKRSRNCDVIHCLPSSIPRDGSQCFNRRLEACAAATTRVDCTTRLHHERTGFGTSWIDARRRASGPPWFSRGR